MTAYMKGDLISKGFIDDAIEITDEKYVELRNSILSGKKVSIRNGEPFIYSGDKRTVYQLVNNLVTSQEILKEDETPEGWQDTEPTPEPINYSTVSKLKLKRKLEQITEEGETDSLWVKLRALMIANPDMWDEWIIAGDIDIDDTMSVSAYTAMGKDKPWMQDLFNDINTQQS
ncbi:MAG TPA: hypothetical protein ENI26_01880 [Methylophaga aminisulfidivorans]|uniref:Uncharacterized protein n=1 Tax=Methylophaga aminisulfidivorans TaxID=230105 RepID=A0A7C1VP16_9GAMM|nr:hypothetical protein [Methylophaga aminisulfidivorans]